MIRVLFNKKGGVGKSSLTVNLAAISAHHGFKTLLVDLDTQCNSTAYLDAIKKDDDCTIANLFEQTITFHLHRKPAKEFCQPTKVTNLDIIAGSARLSELESELDSRHKIYKLKEALETLSTEYDRIYIDTAPALNFYSLSALIAASRCLIPIDCDDFARQGLYSLQQKIAEIREDHNPDLEIEGIIANQFMSNANLPKQIINELIEENYPVLAEYVSQSVKMRESHQAKSPLIEMAPKHKLTLSLVGIFELIEKTK
ncbi:ParA family protein [Aliiglaciecola sp. 2_MG-2023]|uniref:ParA family protein n=1 Tax=Alteromonadaceae TaxID=72275 RepID=UPI001C08F786|nr:MULTISPECIES: ParA family protein [Aliiglaciecola]MBU2880083.1 ParA family protein [Aliiglaciecola lipolytica]MDO6710919.1 ParA family protein [Aliiglaciecola sp. 2_MG-2023]MDO6752400.1 ParA family protein [Aliiglaciecola sp. 1_MG-2023]